MGLAGRGLRRESSALTHLEKHIIVLRMLGYAVSHGEPRGRGHVMLCNRHVRVHVMLCNQHVRVHVMLCNQHVMCAKNVT